MELLQNQNYKFEELTISYLHEVKSQIESVIELCREGEISVHDAERIISNEYFSSVKYQHELWEKLNNYDIENDIENDFTVSPEGYKILGEKAAFSDLIKNDLQNLIDKLSDYIAFLSGIAFNNKLSEILLTDDYQQKRKTKLKTQNNIKRDMHQHENNSTLPPVIKAILKAGFLHKDPDPATGKYIKMDDKKDIDIIKWVFDHSVYEDTLTTSLYLQYIFTTGVEPQSIGQYISRSRSEAKSYSDKPIPKKSKKK